MKKSDTYLFEEEHFHSKKRKDIKKDRRALSLKDRSKYKKTDLKTLEKQKSTKKQNLLKGRVLSITGEQILVDFEGKEYIATLRGVLKKEKSKDRNIVAVGDFVLFALSNGQGQIHKIEKRFSFLSRKGERTQKKQLIAVNIDQVFITASVDQPTLKPHLIDRFMIAAKKGKMKPVILINKVDLLKGKTFPKEEKKLFKEFLLVYESLGIPILCMSVKKKIGIRKLKSFMKNKTSVFAGQSGVGKSSLINAALKLNLKVGSIVHKTQKGAHVTTKAQLIPLKSGGFCIDTPGIKSFGIWDLEKKDIVDHFHEIKKIATHCKYSNCIHLDEPGCAVLKAVEKKQISCLRISSFHSLMKEI